MDIAETACDSFRPARAPKTRHQSEGRGVNPILVVDDIVKRFETPDGVLTAVDHVSFDVKPGEFLAVIGPSGCGKSTLFNVIGGLTDSYDGHIAVGGEKVRGPHASVGMVFQEESTFPWRTVIENVAFPLEIAGMVVPALKRPESATDPAELLRAAIPQQEAGPITTASLSKALDAMRRRSHEDHGV